MSAKDEKSAHSPIRKEDAASLGLGAVTISDAVIAALAAQAARKVEGVLLVGSSFKLSEILSGKEAARKGISVKTDEDSGHAEIDVDVNVTYGVNIYEVASELQRVIKEEVEALTGSMNVDRVNVRIKAVIMPGEEQREPVSPDKAFEEVNRGED